MKKFISWIKDEESGQGMVEYGLIIALVSVVAILVLTGLGTNLIAVFTDASEAID